jgi:hypothetical protein
MSAIKDGRFEVEIGGEKYKLLFSLNVLDEMQDKFGGYDKLGEAFNSSNPNMIKDLRWLLTELINEGLEEDKQTFTEKQIGKMIHIGNLQQIKDAIFSAFVYSANGGEEDEQQGENEDTEGNMTAAQEG